MAFIRCFLFPIYVTGVKNDDAIDWDNDRNNVSVKNSEKAVKGETADRNEEDLNFRNSIANLIRGG